MIRRISDFLQSWDFETSSTAKMLGNLTDASLNQPVADGHRTLGHVAWHLVTTLPEMMNRTGLAVTGPEHTAPAPATAGEIVSAYQAASASLGQQIKDNWSDETLDVVDDMYGEQWPRAATLAALISHEIHHRGQLSVLMRQAGLRVPGIYGPAKEDWASMGMEAPPQ